MWFPHTRTPGSDRLIDWVLLLLQYVLRAEGADIGEGVEGESSLVGGWVWGLGMWVNRGFSFKISAGGEAEKEEGQLV